MGDYGYSIEHILMVDIIPDAAVRRAMNEINAGMVPYMSYFFHSVQPGGPFLGLFDAAMFS